MGPSRKRKELSTLLDFFSSSDGVKRAKLKTSQQSSSSDWQPTKVAPREIIIIDSDSDDCSHEKQNGKRSARQEWVEVSEVPRTLTFSSPTSIQNESGFGASSELLQGFQAVKPSMEAFKEPKTCSTVLKPDQCSHSMFGVSAPLLDEEISENSLTKMNRAVIDTRENTTAMVTKPSGDELAVDFAIGEWGAEDDELFALETSERRVDQDVEGPRGNRRLCPVCGVDLTGILISEAQIHVNNCLDKNCMQHSNLAKQEATMSIELDVTSSDGSAGARAKSQGGDLYTVLMNSHKENEIQAEVDAIDSEPIRRNRRKAPFYKVLQGMPIAVDAFCYGAIPGVSAYFLTHAHSDHYTSLGSKWKAGPIYCSEETANLIIHMLAMDPIWIHPLPLDVPIVIPDTGGVTVTLIEANHCPGSCLFFFEGRQTVDAGDSAFKSSSVGSPSVFRYLHCGDFRASPRHVLHPAVKGKCIDLIYLDTTYLDPKYTFPPQPLVISACAELARELVMGGLGVNFASRSSTIDAWIKCSTSSEQGGQTLEKRTLVVVGTYSVGKERIVKAIAQALRTKIYCDPRKTAILRCQADTELHALLTADPAQANVHVLPLGTITLDNLKLYLQKFGGAYLKVIGFRPTGWTYYPPSGKDVSPSIQSVISRGQSQHFSSRDLQPSQKSTYHIQIFGVPYSEHSSFFELTCFAMSCDWGRMIPTVNVGSPTSRAKMTRWLKQWESERRKFVIQPRTTDYW